MTLKPAPMKAVAMTEGTHEMCGEDVSVCNDRKRSLLNNSINDLVVLVESYWLPSATKTVHGPC